MIELNYTCKNRADEIEHKTIFVSFADYLKNIEAIHTNKTFVANGTLYFLNRHEITLIGDNFPTPINKKYNRVFARALKTNDKLEAAVKNADSATTEKQREKFEREEERHFNKIHEIIEDLPARERARLAKVINI